MEGIFKSANICGYININIWKIYGHLHNKTCKPEVALSFMSQVNWLNWRQSAEYVTHTESALYRSSAVLQEGRLKGQAVYLCSDIKCWCQLMFNGKFKLIFPAFFFFFCNFVKIKNIFFFINNLYINIFKRTRARLWHISICICVFNEYICVFWSTWIMRGFELVAMTMLQLCTNLFFVFLVQLQVSNTVLRSDSCFMIQLLSGGKHTSPKLFKV